VQWAGHIFQVNRDVPCGFYLPAFALCAVQCFFSVLGTRNAGLGLRPSRSFFATFAVKSFFPRSPPLLYANSAVKSFYSVLRTRNAGLGLFAPFAAFLCGLCG
jgi:hypothetical protein